MNKEININLGCGVKLLENFINIDNTFSLSELKTKKGLFKNAYIPKNAEFIKADMRMLPLKDNLADYIECISAIEHVPFADVEIVLKEIYRVLKPNGKVIIFTSDFDDITYMWQEYIKNIQPFNSEAYFTMIQAIYGSQISYGEYHRSAFNPLYIHGLFHSLGFKDIKVIVYPRGTHPPALKGHQFPSDAFFITGMLLVEASKPEV